MRSRICFQSNICDFKTIVISSLIINKWNLVVIFKGVQNKIRLTLLDFEAVQFAPQVPEFVL